MRNVLMLTGVSADGIRSYKQPNEEQTAFIQANHDRLRALLDKPVILTVHWDDGDADALVTIMPDDMGADPHKPFDKLRLPVPGGEQ